MSEYVLEITLLSDALIGSGEGWGGVIDSDVTFDDFGIPYIPARRIKGCLREAAMEVVEAFSDVEGLSGMIGNVKELFGTAEKGSKTTISNAYIKDYNETKQWLKYFSTKCSQNNQYNKFKNIFTPETLIDSFTTLRNQTKINEKGIAEDHSLRTSRVLKKGISFISNISFNEDSENNKTLLALSTKVLRNMGKMRNRGFGHVECLLKKDEKCIIDEEITKFGMLIDNKDKGITTNVPA